MLKKIILPTIAYLFLVASFISLLPIWIGDLFSHFRMFWTVFSFIFLIAYFFLAKEKSYQSSFACLLFALLINLYGSFSFWTNTKTYKHLFLGSPDKVEISKKIEQRITNDTTTKSLLLMNVLSSNTNYEEVKRTIKNTDADFVVILELNEKWETELEQLTSTYPYQSKNARENNFGIGFYSKNKIDAFEVYAKIAEENQLLDAKLKDNLIGLEIGGLDKNLKVMITHPIPPVSRRAYHLRNSELTHFSKRAAKFTNQKLLLVGDFNSSPFSADYKNFLAKSNLKDSQENFGFQPTWNSSFPFLMQTQLDHVWHSEDIEILHRQTLPIVGSDHKAVYVVFR